MTQCIITEDAFQPDLFPNLKRRIVEVDFSGGDVSRDGGVLLNKNQTAENRRSDNTKNKEDKLQPLKLVPIQEHILARRINLRYRIDKKKELSPARSQKRG